MSKSHTRTPNLEAGYIPQARRVVVARNLRKKAVDEERDAKRRCASLMHSVSVREFKFTVENQRYKARLARPEAQRISVQKLYTLVREGELPLDEFLELVTADEDAVKGWFAGRDYNRLKETYRKPLDLIIKEIKQ